MRALIVAIVLATAATAHAQAGAWLSESSRAASLATSITARGGEIATIHANPAALGALDRPIVTLSGNVGRLRLDAWRDGEPATIRARELVAGYGVALALPLPGPEWLSRARVGAALQLPVEHVLHVSAAPRIDAPTPALYDARIERTAAVLSLAYELPWLGISLGGGVAIAPTLFASTTVRFDPSRGETVDDGVIVEAEREVRFDAAPIVGLHARPHEMLQLGLAYHGAVVTRAAGPNDLRAGPVLADDPVDFTLFYEPESVTGAAVLAPIPELTISADVAWQRWSSHRTAHGVDGGLGDVVAVRGGIEWTHAFFALRVGYGFEPTPVGAQRGATTLIDGDRHVLALGLGVDLERWCRLPLRIDLHGRAHAITPFSAQKDPSLLPDADPATPGIQIADLGYPGIDARLGFFQVGVSVTVLLAPPTRGAR